MKTLQKTMLVAVVAGLASVTAYADNTGPYVGIKAGKYVTGGDLEDYATSVSGAATLSDPSMAGVTAGYQFNKMYGVELEYASSGTQRNTIGNSQPSATVSISDATTREKLQHLGAYATARVDLPTTTVPMYVKGKLGVAQNKYENQYRATVTETVTTTAADGTTTETQVTNNIQAKRDKDKVSVAGGVALGMKPIKKLDNLAVEMEYGYYDKDAQSVNFNMQYQF